MFTKSIVFYAEYVNSQQPDWHLTHLAYRANAKKKRDIVTVWKRMEGAH